MMLSCFLLSPLAYAQAPPEDAPVIPPKLLVQAELSYPEGAQGSGEVLVTVLVGVDGKVQEARFSSGGPEIFIAPALEAAKTLVFEPATQNGAPVSASVLVRFPFDPLEPALEEEWEEEEVNVVAERDRTAGESHAVSVIGMEALERSSGEDLAETLSEIPGVAVARGGTAGTKPIIRGQFERRLLVLVDGIRHESQKWGLDHATEVDPFSAGSIHVIKGAAGVRYGPDAIGGVVLVEPLPLRDEVGVTGKIQAAGTYNGLGGVFAGRLDGVPAPDLSFRLEGNYSRSAAIHTPAYVLGNTGSEEWNLGTTASYHRDSFNIKLGYHHYSLESGVCYCVQSGTPDDFLAQLDLNAPIGSENWTTSYAIDRPYQAVTHELALARAAIGMTPGDLRVTYAFQLNHRQEFEQTRSSITGPQYDFVLRTHSLDLLFEHATLTPTEDLRLTGEAGLSSSFQENVYSGLPLIPNFRAFQVGVFAFERLNIGLLLVEAGARYDHLSRSAFLTESAFERSLSRGTLTERDCERTDSAARCPVSYDAGSFSVGLLYLAIPGKVEARLDLSSASRFPNADELYMNGSAPTFPVYALGDPSLSPETTWGASPTLGVRLSWIESEISVYSNYIHDYVYFAPELDDTGNPAVDVTIQGAFPRFSYRPIEAVFYGADGGLTFGPALPVHLSLQGALVRARNADTGGFLVMAPADRVGASLEATHEQLGPLQKPFAEVEAEYVFEQTHIDPNADIAPPPPAYFLLNASAGLSFLVKSRELSFSIEATNLLNQRYRDYSSLLRYYANEPGRDVRLRVNFTF
jgi:iron complex outermembrane receptor protein